MTDISQERIAETVKRLRCYLASREEAVDLIEFLAARLAEVEAERDKWYRAHSECADFAEQQARAHADDRDALLARAEAAESRLSASADPVCDDRGITTTPASESREQRMLEPVQGPFVEDDLPPPAALTAGETGELVERQAEEVIDLWFASLSSLEASAITLIQRQKLSAAIALALRAAEADKRRMREALKPFAMLHRRMWVSGHCGGASPEDWPDKWRVLVHGPDWEGLQHWHDCPVLTVGDFRRAADLHAGGNAEAATERERQLLEALKIADRELESLGFVSPPEVASALSAGGK